MPHKPGYGDNSGHDTDCDCKACLIDTWHAEVDELRAEIRRLRASLQEIRDHGTDNGHECWALHQGDCADTFQEIARSTLNAS